VHLKEICFDGVDWIHLAQDAEVAVPGDTIVFEENSGKSLTIQLLVAVFFQFSH
jgi:hypothetical protein